MKKLTTVLIILFLFQSSIFGQRDADWEVTVPGKIQSILFQNLTGVPIIQTNEAFCGINSETKDVAWKMDRKSNGIVELTNDFYEVQNSPFVLISHDLIDSRDGKVILSKEKDGHKKIHDAEYIPDLDAMLLRAGADGQLRVYMVDMKTNTKKWGVDVMKSSGFGQMMATSKMSGSKETEVPDISIPIGTTPITENGNILYKFRKNVAVLDAETGKVKWKIKGSPARLIPTPDNSALIVVESDGGGLMAAAMAPGTKSMSKKAVVYDMESGKELWKVKTGEDIRRIKTWDDHLFIADKESCNFYSYKDGKKMWKKNYSQKRIGKIEKNDEGYMVYSGRKSMQIDGEGKKMWKKPKKAPRNWGSGGGSGDEGPSYESGTLAFAPTGISFTPEPGSKAKSFSIKTDESSKMSYDPKRNNLIVIAGRDVYIINPDKNPKGYMVWKKKVRNSAGYTTMEVRENAYFMTAIQEFVIVFPDKKTATGKFYPKPFDKKNLLSNAASFGMAAYSAANAIGGVTNTMKGAAGVASFGMTPIGDGTAQLTKGGNQFNNADRANKVSEFIPPTRKAAFSQTRDFAYYFTKEKDAKGDKNKLLMCVSKDTGEEVDKLLFDSVRPVYKVDEFERKVYYGNKSLLKVFQL